MNKLNLIKIKNLPDNPNGALTLNPSYLGEHEDGWEIVGTVHKDYFEWINRFVAYKHEPYCEQIVCGDFEEAVFATSQEAYDEFIKNYPPEAWNYGDI